MKREIVKGLCITFLLVIVSSFTLFIHEKKSLKIKDKNNYLVETAEEKGPTTEPEENTNKTEETNNLEFSISDNTIIIDKDNRIISRIIPGKKIVEFRDMVSYENGTIYLTDSVGNMKQDNEILKTGDILHFKNNDLVVASYSISIIGDVLGTGVVTIDDAKQIASYIIDGDFIFKNGSLAKLSADVNGNGKIKMNDVMELIQSIENNK